jgi:phage gp29-like protein
MARKRPPVKRSRQKAATTALAKQKPVEAEILTLADIRAIRNTRQINPRVVGGRVLPNRNGMEFGSSGTFNVYGRISNEDYNPLFDGKTALVTYDQMDRSDGQIGAAGEIIKMPIRAAQFRIVPPEKPTNKEKQIAEAAHDSLFGEGIWPQGEGWDFTLRHLLMSVPFGFGCVEKIWKFDEDAGLLRWGRFAPRLPKTVDRFDVWPDGTLKNIVQYVSTPGTGAFAYKTIPADYAILSVREREGDNYFGKSIYRRLYKHWFYKDDAYRIDGIRLDRYGVGVPVAKIDSGYPTTEDELNEIEMVLMALRSHERAYIIEPAGVTFRIMTPEGGHGGATGLMESVNHHDGMIVRGILATFLSDNAEGLNTNRTRTLADVFLHALKGEARRISNDLMSQAVRQFCDYNFDMADARYPVMEISGIGDLSPEQLATALAPLVTAGVVTAEDTLEEAIRKIFGLPPLVVGWRRGEKKPEIPVAAAPGTPAETGRPNPPRSAKAQAGAVDDNGDPIAADNVPPQPITVTVHNEIPPPPNDAIIALAQEMKNVVEAVRSQPPPQPPQIVVNMGGKKRTIVEKRDEHGRVEQTITETVQETEHGGSEA